MYDLLNLVESSANVENLPNLARKAFDIDDLVLVQANFVAIWKFRGNKKYKFCVPILIFYMIDILIFDCEFA